MQVRGNYTEQKTRRKEWEIQKRGYKLPMGLGDGVARTSFDPQNDTDGERQRQTETEAACEERLFNIFPNLAKGINSQIQEITNSISSQTNRMLMTP